jgi:hypothetical protein
MVTDIAKERTAFFAIVKQSKETLSKRPKTLIFFALISVLQPIRLPVFVFIPMSRLSFSSFFSIFSSLLQSIKGFYTYFVDGWIPSFVFMVETRLRSHWSASGSTVCSQVA